ncbi:Fe-S oxidoreductase [Solibacillus sp. R5-41]|uniref:Fe-S oxidoreductase n=1 Tax=Solibacillus sp. R5-41 TaxID=2048654 RepID=UPI000C1248CB|nr:Fe-S oxidoreductase [Solibacillus sp. R5-41]ATP40075.1 Fe-S oxidoreductase [Solibacillus sp. R5-41]
MKKYWIFLLLLVLAGCSSSNNDGAMLFTEKQAVPFEIVKYEEKIAPVYESLVPYISYASTEGQLKELQARFKVEGFTVDMDNYMAVFLVTYSDSCGIAVDGVYNDAGKLAVQLMDVQGTNCEKEGIPHTFVLQVPKQDYEKVQFYNGNIIKSSTEIKN